MAAISFHPHKKEGTCKMYLRLRFGRKKEFRMSTGLTIKEASDWGRYILKGTFKGNKTLVRRLEELRHSLEDYLDEIEKDKERNLLDLSSVDIKKRINRFNNSEPVVNKDLLIPFSEWYCKDLVNRTYRKNDVKHKLKQGTIDKYVNFTKILKEYQNSLKSEIKLADIDEVFVNKFLTYLTDVKNLSINTKGRYVKRLKTILKDAQIKGFKVNPQYVSIKGFQDETVVTFLTFEELDQIIETEMPTERLDIAKDWLIIACYTAQRISDLHRFSRKNIQTIQGGRYISAKQFKTKKNIEIPIHYKVDAVLNKYNNNFPPRYTDNEHSQRSMLSLYIKEVCRIAGIKEEVYGRYNGKMGYYPKYKLISPHTGRRSFASNFYNLPNWSIQEIMNITGHETERNFLAYISKEDPTLSRNARNKFDEMERADKEKKEPQLNVIKNVSNN